MGLVLIQWILRLAAVIILGAWALSSSQPAIMVGAMVGAAVTAKRLAAKNEG